MATQQDRKPKGKNAKPQPPVASEATLRPTAQQQESLPTATSDALSLSNEIPDDERKRWFVLTICPALGGEEQKTSVEANAKTCKIAKNSGFSEFRSIELQLQLDKLTEQQRLLVTMSYDRLIVRYDVVE